MVVEGKPLPQKRHRHGRGRVYDPSRMDKRDFLAKAMNYLADKPKYHAWVKKWADESDYIAVVISFVMPIPKSMSKKVIDARPFVRHNKKPDIDNLLKFVLDSFNGYFWPDDNMVASATVEKYYGAIPQTKITIIYRKWSTNT